MKNVVDSRHHKTDYPLYLQKAPEQRRAPSGNPWDSLARLTKATAAVPAKLCIRITDRAPHELSRTTLSVIDLLLNGDLLRLRSEEIADTLHISPTTLRRRLRADGTNYQSILDHVRRKRYTVMLEKRWLPGKCVAWELGYAEVNSFYRAFRRWTGHNYSDLKQLYI
jgi:AraC-like DNA-binding protein